MEQELNMGILIIGMSNTLLFSGESTTELVLLHMATGEDFTMPITEEQAAMLLHAMGLAEEVVEDEDGPKLHVAQPEAEETPQL